MSHIPLNRPSTVIIGSRGMLGQDLMKMLPHAVSTDADTLDITDQAAVNIFFAKVHPTVVINAAAYNAVDACETDDIEYQRALLLNATAVGYLADACLRHGATLVHYSTNYVFDGATAEGYAESDKPHPINRYGETKLRGEREILQRTQEGLQHYIIRTSKLFGTPGASPAAKQSFFAAMLQRAQGQTELSVVDDEASNFTYTPDLAEYTKKLLERPYPGGIYHGVNEGACTWFEGACVLFDMVGRGVKLTPVGAEAFARPARRPHTAILLNTKGPMMRDWKEALTEFLISKQFSMDQCFKQ